MLLRPGFEQSDGAEEEHRTFAETAREQRVTTGLEQVRAQAQELEPSRWGRTPIYCQGKTEPDYLSQTVNIEPGLR